MDLDWNAITAGVGVLGAAGATVKGIATAASFKTNIEGILKDHGERLDRIEKALPNGEIREIHSLVKELHERMK